MRKFLFISLSIFLISSCGSTQKVSKSKEEFGVSPKDYPYIDAFHKGVRLKSQGRLDEAQEQFEYCLTQRQDDDAVYYALSQIELRKDNPQKSAEYITKAAEIDPGNIWYSQELAYMYYEFKEFDKSAEYFKKLVDKNPENPEWLFGYAEVLSRNGQTSKAVEVLNELEGQMGKNPQLSIQKYTLLIASKQEEKALNELLAIQKEYPKDPQIIATLIDHYYQTKQNDKAEEMLVKLVEADPTNGRAHLALGDAYMRSNEIEKGYGHFKKAYQSDEIEPKLKLQVLFSLLQSKQKDDPQIIELLEILEEKHPDNHSVATSIGEYHLAKGELDKGLSYFKKSVELNPNQYEVWNQVAIMDYQLGKTEDLYQDTKSALELFPTIGSLYLLNGIGANQTKRYSEAVESLNTGVELVGSDKGLKAEFYGQLGDAHFGLNEISEGKKNYQKAIQLDASSNLLKNNFAYRLAQSKTDLELATSLIDQVIAKESNPQFLDTKGFVEFQKGNYSEAKKLFMQAIASGGSEDGVIHEHIGNTYAKMGNIQSALDAWKEAQKLGIDTELLKKKISDKKYYDKLP